MERQVRWHRLLRLAANLRLILAELQVVTVRAQVSVPLLLAFATGAYAEFLTASVATMLDQLLALARGMRTVREAKALAVA